MLNRSSNMFLVKDLLNVEIDCQENMYPNLLLQTEISKIVVQHVSQCRAALTSLGCPRERIPILFEFHRPIGKFLALRGLAYVCRLRLDVEGPFSPLHALAQPEDPSGNHISSAPVEFIVFLQKHILLPQKTVRPG